MKPGKYRTRPRIVEAVEFTGKNAAELAEWIRTNGGTCATGMCARGDLFIRTLEGDMEARAGDYVIRGVQGDFYPCKPDVFAETYGAA